MKMDHLKMHFLLKPWWWWFYFFFHPIWGNHPKYFPDGLVQPPTRKSMIFHCQCYFSGGYSNPSQSEISDVVVFFHAGYHPRNYARAGSLGFCWKRGKKNHLAHRGNLLCVFLVSWKWKASFFRNEGFVTHHFWGPGKLHLGMTKTTWDVSKLVGVRWDKSRRTQVVQDCWATGWQKIWDKPSLCQASCYLTSLVVGPYLCTCLDGAGGAEGTTRRSQVLKRERWDWSGMWGIYLHVVDFTSKM